jgi:cytoplasmic iron level regulating protein YaaA (DUF328/UPF0246 family)
VLLLLPPSETKRDGGVDEALDYGRLAYPRLSARRRAVVRAVTSLARDPEAASKALKLGPTQAGEVTRNRKLRNAPTMAAIDRYTGVLFDALDSGTLTTGARARAHEIVRIQSSLLGPVAALDPIPAYRLSHDSRLPGLPLKAHWSAPVARELAGHSGLLLDLRSEGYAALGPAPKREDAYYLRVLTRTADGEARALNHFNKHAKGVFTRSLLLAADLPDDVHDLLDWARGAGWDARLGGAGTLHLFV